MLREFHELSEDVDDEALRVNETWREDRLREVEAMKVQLAVKTEVVVPDTGTEMRQGGNAFGTFFEKQKPPKFNGDCLDYCEWKLKWNEVVHCHNIPERQELGLLKECIPENAKKKLYKVESLDNAWEKLQKLFGNPSLITQMLKTRLKEIKPMAKLPHEILIELADG